MTLWTVDELEQPGGRVTLADRAGVLADRVGRLEVVTHMHAVRLGDLEERVKDLAFEVLRLRAAGAELTRELAEVQATGAEG